MATPVNRKIIEKKMKSLIKNLEMNENLISFFDNKYIIVRWDKNKSFTYLYQHYSYESGWIFPKNLISEQNL
jgi:hypothetical protein